MFSFFGESRPGKGRQSAANDGTAAKSVSPAASPRESPADPQLSTARSAGDGGSVAQMLRLFQEQQREVQRQQAAMMQALHDQQALLAAEVMQLKGQLSSSAEKEETASLVRSPVRDATNSEKPEMQTGSGVFHAVSQPPSPEPVPSWLTAVPGHQSASAGDASSGNRSIENHEGVRLCDGDSKRADSVHHSTQTGAALGNYDVPRSSDDETPQGSNLATAGRRRTASVPGDDSCSRTPAYRKQLPGQFSHVLDEVFVGLNDRAGRLFLVFQEFLEAVHDRCVECSGVSRAAMTR